ncbi:MAG: hypothetical protein WBC68_12050 [Albidovulum sp.]
MTRRFIAALTIAALTLGSAFATPASALGDKDRKALTLLLGAAAVGLLINESNKKRNKAAPVTKRYDGYTNNNSDRGNKFGHRKRAHDNYSTAKRRNVIPAQCVFPIRGAYGRRDVVSERCLRETGRARRLPDACAFNINDDWGRRTVYGTRCLRQNGFEIAQLR